jgi:hypothetical protein
MVVELEGKGIVCDVYYLTEDRFLTLIADAENKSVGLISLITEYCDCHILVSQGFFADNPDTSCKFIRDSSETTSVAMNEILFLDEFLNGKEKSDISDDSDGLDSFTVRSCEEYPEPTENQVCLVAYSEFEHGKSATSLPIDATDSLKGLRFITKSVDFEGFVSRATYEENIVGSDEYNRAEEAILGIEFRGQQFWIASPIYQKARNRVWLYKFDENEQSHQLDFMGSKKIRWLSASDDQSRARIIVQ